MPITTTRIVPTAVLARGARHLVKDGPCGGSSLQIDADLFVATPSVESKAPTIQIPSEMAAGSPDKLYELGLTTAAMGFHTAALEALRDCTRRAPDHAAAWRKLAELLRLAREDMEAEAADAAAERASAAARKWIKARDERGLDQLERSEGEFHQRYRGSKPDVAMAALRDHLVANPLDAAAMRLLAQLEAVTHDEITAMRLLERALYLCPDYTGARENYAALLQQRDGHAQAVVHTALLVAHDPHNPYYRLQHARLLLHTGNADGAIDILVGLLRENPGHTECWLWYARALQYVGRREESVQAFRQCLAISPTVGAAYWGLADLKDSYLTEADIANMRAQLEGNALESEDRKYMLYALAHALERARDFAASFAAYDEGARLRRARFESGAKEKDRRDDIERKSAEKHQTFKTVFSRENLARLAQAPAAAPRDTPIFVVGLPRAGSTLVEQILASHSQVEGTRELPLISGIAIDLALSRMLVEPHAYPECLLEMGPAQLAALGERYIREARAYRKTERPYFIDKRPWNWQDAGLIHLILPHAKIIDVRREPMAACFAVFKQLLPMEPISCDLTLLGHYYNRYVRMMEHWESAMPGVVHFVQYERLVEDTEGEIRRMLEYCSLPFEEGCLRYWETDRAVITPSAEQVRRPIYRDALRQWRNFEPWLGPLKEALAQQAGDPSDASARITG